MRDDGFVRSRVVGLKTLIALSLIALLAGGSVRPAVASVAELPYRLTPTMTSSMGTNQRSLAADGALIVWEDSRSGAPDIYAYDLDDGREFRVARGAAARTEPAVSGSLIVWVTDLGAEGRRIEGIDLARGETFQVTDTPAQVTDPAISDGIVVWREQAGAMGAIRARDLRGGQVIELPDERSNQAHPAISGSRIVWQEFRDGSWDLALHDTASGRTVRLTEGPDDDTAPCISGDHVAFLRQSPTGGPPALIVRDLTSGAEQTIVSGHMILQPSIADGIVVWEDWRTGLPDIYAYDIAHQEQFAIARSQRAYDPAVSARGVAWLSRDDMARGRVQAISFVERLPTDPREPPAVPSPDHVYVPETKHFMSAGFKSFWQAHGGPQLFGYPLTEEFEEIDEATGEAVVVQYFERVKLEYRPEPGGDNPIRIARLGAELTADREFETVAPFESSEERRYFPETRHSLAHGFKRFWEENGGLAIFGYPISEEITENGRTVQYFERARFELHADEDGESYRIKLGLIGQEALQRKGWLPSPPLDTTMLYE